MLHRVEHIKKNIDLLLIVRICIENKLIIYHSLYFRLYALSRKLYDRFNSEKLNVQWANIVNSFFFKVFIIVDFLFPQNDRWLGITIWSLATIYCIYEIITYNILHIKSSQSLTTVTWAYCYSTVHSELKHLVSRANKTFMTK